LLLRQIQEIQILITYRSKTQAFGLNMITLLSHTSHALQLLDVAYFKPFKTTLEKKEML
jgi:hypothetical protein